ncbi:transporter substrate-binding domain-containing protein [Cocleimonas flava]|uniref:Amino acid ABC transporter substrate-binding protein (PAAT family) n=2 Tax=Cocleimonas flava TaxID=634765 RepID=A0A4R1F9T6_9GAMM|nr:amino acid ABC transporter substrate-binding protein (PAAT family) [Cocleimonas flava]
MISSLAMIMCSGFISLHTAYAQPLKFGFGDTETYPRKWKENGEYVGVYIDIIKEVILRSGIDIDLEPYPHERLLQYLEDGKLDGAIGLYKNKEREQYAVYVDIPIAWSSMRIFVKKEDLSSITGLNDLSGKVIGKIRGVSFNKDLEKAIEEGQFTIEETATYEQSIKKLLAGRIDVLIAPNFSTQYLLREMGVSEEISLLPLYFEPVRPVYILFSKPSIITDKMGMFEKMIDVLTDMEYEKTFEEIQRNFDFH